MLLRLVFNLTFYARALILIYIMKGESFDIFYAQLRFPESFRKHVYDEGKDLADSVFSLKSETLRYNIFLVDSSSPYPLSVLLRPDLEAQTKRKAKDCCDKACSSCVLGCADTPAAGFLIKERMKSYFKKDDRLRHLYTHDLEKTLDAMNLVGYVLEEKEISMMLAGSALDSLIHAGERELVTT